MQFNLSMLLAIAMAAVAVASHEHYPKHNGGDHEFNYNKEDSEVDVKNVSSNQCGVTQAQNCCTTIKHGSDEHKEWTKRHEHLRDHQDDGDYLDCHSASPESSAGCSGEAQPFCCNATGSKLSVLNCTPININLPLDAVNQMLSGER